MLARIAEFNTEFWMEIKVSIAYSYVYYIERSTVEYVLQRWGLEGKM
jgi:hypothetical protein